MADDRSDDAVDHLHPETIQQWHDWLHDHHADRSEAWVVGWRTPTGRPQLDYEQLVLEALAYGWVDSKKMTLDAERSAQRFSPRRPTSGWVRVNKERVARLEAEGRLQPAGRAAIETAKANGSWTLYDAVEDLIVPDDLAAAFTRHAGAAEHWEGFSKSSRKAALTWIVTAKRSDTRASRIAEIALRAARNQPPTR